MSILQSCIVYVWYCFDCTKSGPVDMASTKSGCWGYSVLQHHMSTWWHHHGHALLILTATQIFFVDPLQVGTNGYFSFGTRQTVAPPTVFSSTSPYNYLVAPFWADIDISIHGSISYEVHNTSAGSSSIALLNGVSTFISNQQNTQFSGNWMLVASWSQVSAYHGSSSIVSS